MTAWIILGIIYAICFIPAWFMTRVITSSHPMKRDEMAIKIHDIQRMIISRPGFRLNKEKFRDYGEGNSDKG